MEDYELNPKGCSDSLNRLTYRHAVKAPWLSFLRAILTRYAFRG